jgi:lipopolysaccharide/colanic/teichoic acid biosynthesis glycosyltransferase
LPETGVRAGRACDLFLGSVLLLITLPLAFFVAIAIKLDSPGPILVRERRIDRYGRRFFALKFRITGDSGSQRDADITFVGNIIHFLRIDNVPQLINVLRGEMTCMMGDADSVFFLD